MRKQLMSVKSFLIAICTIFILAQCSEEDVVPEQPIEAAAEELPLAEAPTGSMTISGVFTSYEEIKDCKTCTYVVPENSTLVDGKELGLKAGAVICLDKAKAYGDIEFVNLEGTEDKPIRIGGAFVQN